MTTEKPVTHRVTVETSALGRTRRNEHNVRLTPKMAITNHGERFPRNGSWKHGTAFTGSRRILPATLRPITVDEQRKSLQEAVNRATGELNSASRGLKDAQEEVDYTIKELAVAQEALAKFDKQHGEEKRHG